MTLSVKKDQNYNRLLAKSAFVLLTKAAGRQNNEVFTEETDTTTAEQDRVERLFAKLKAVFVPGGVCLWRKRGQGDV